MRARAAACWLLLSLAASPAGAGTDPGEGAVLLVRSGGDSAWRPVPALATDVEIRVTGVLARGHVVQRFRNPSDVWLEALYVFPLPDQAAVDHLELRAGGRVIEGRIRERAEAERSYQEARSAGKRAARLGQARPDVFTLSVANLGPGEEVEVALEYQETVPFDAAGFRLRFPMVVAPRYQPEAAQPPSAGDPVDLPPSTPPYLHPADGPANPVRLRVDLEAGFPVAWIASPSHVVAVESPAPDRRRVVLGDYADRDFVLEWRPETGSEPRVALLAEPDGDGAYLLLMILPPEGDEVPVRLSREVVFVIDTSGSMAGPGIEQARRALLLALERLGPDDRFEVIRFDDRTERLFGSVVPADAAHRAAARRFVAALEADGGTEMLPALRAALEGDTGSGDVRQVVFVTDGGIGNDGALFREIASRLGRSRLFSVGIGSAPNGAFLARAAALGRGTHTFVANPAEVDEKVGALLAKLERPVLSDLEVHWNDAVETWPERVPDLYAGEPLVVAARVPRFVGEIAVRGRRGERPFEVRIPLAPGAAERGIGVLFARRKIAALLESRATGADPQAVRAAVLATALEHHLVSPYTSLVAVDVTPVRPAGEALRTAAVPANLPAGWGGVEVGGVLPRAGSPAPLLRTHGALLLALAAGLAALRPGRRGAA
jgi:Ca-activated chloride channel family protein